MKRPTFFPSHLAALAASVTITTATLLSVAPVLRAQSPTPEPTEAKHDASGDIFEAIKKGADKPEKQAKDAGKIEPQLKQLEARQAEYIKHQEEVERRLAGLLLQQNEEISKLTQAVQALQAEVKAAHAAAPAAPLPATEPSKAP